jgi:pimeloyl-ACP methyl ester carboxylesterase
VDVIGVSTGGSIVEHLVADHPDTVLRLACDKGASIYRRGYHP